MAAHVELEDILEMTVLPYAALRDELQSGDIFFGSSDYILGRAIRATTDSPWSHVGIVLRFDDFDRLLLLESVEDVGVRFAPLSKYFTNYVAGEPYNGRLVIARFRGLTGGLLNGLSRFGMDELTRPYDVAEIAKIAARIALGLGRSHRDRDYICSELVYECFRAGGYDFEFDQKGFISPENIWRDANVELVGRIL